MAHDRFCRCEGCVADAREMEAETEETEPCESCGEIDCGGLDLNDDFGRCVRTIERRHLADQESLAEDRWLDRKRGS